MKKPFQTKEMRRESESFANINAESEQSVWKNKLFRYGDAYAAARREKYPAFFRSEDNLRRSRIFLDFMRKLFLLVPVLFILQTVSISIGYSLFNVYFTPRVVWELSILLLILGVMSVLFWASLGNISKPRKLLIPLMIILSSMLYGWWSYNGSVDDDLQILLNSSVMLFPFHLLATILADKYIDRNESEKVRRSKVY